jgi:adenylate cyclase
VNFFSQSQVVALLNQVFSTIQGILDKYGLEQLKTVGDALIVAGPLYYSKEKGETDALETAKKVGLVALEIVRVVQTPLHVGIHTGPVVAGVIGRKRFTYDLYGETVDIANELGAKGHPGKVIVSTAFKHLLPTEFIYSDEETIESAVVSSLQIYSLSQRG